MAMKSGTSHALAVLLCTLIGAFLVDLTRPLFPEILKSAALLTQELVARLDLPLDPGMLTVAFAASIAAFIWGLLYHAARGR